ncbi:MAG TPA: hypothetical protein VHN74_01935 [Candidatus Angelobacter sp.]|jgi:ABC-type glycerol-3-phosphate transport system permease component|nr:hypothetical protein [Candidatus Angelobacter sp.]
MEEPRPELPRRIGLALLGMLICWSLNVFHLGLSFWIFTLLGEKFLAPFYVLVGGIGVLQMAYVVPLYRLLRRKNLPEAALGLILAACITLFLSASFDYHGYRQTHPKTPTASARNFIS